MGQENIRRKFGTPYVFFQMLTLPTSNLVQNLGLGLAYQKTTFRTKICGGLGQQSIQKIWDPLCIFATVEASNFKFGTQIGFGTSLPKMTFRNEISGGMGWEAHKKLGPLRISATIEFEIWYTNLAWD